MSYSQKGFRVKRPTCCGIPMGEINPNSDLVRDRPDGEEVYVCSKCGAETII